MHTKHSNIFWHEGVRIFGERMLGSEQGQVRIRHLENDVTKALLNVFEHGERGSLYPVTGSRCESMSLQTSMLQGVLSGNHGT